MTLRKFLTAGACLAYLLVFPLTVKGEMTVKDVFPKSSDLKGGASAWIVSGIKEETRGRCRLYENSYTYYSEKAEKILDIQRNNTYAVSARVYACDNFLAAAEKYGELSKAEKKYSGEKRSAPAPFGERGTLFAVPVEGQTVMADFYLTFIYRTFVVQVYSDDGFAQMDAAGFIEKKLALYLAERGASYFINKINLTAEYQGREYSSSLSFTGDNITSVFIEGSVFGSDNAPLPGVKIKARETGAKTETDAEGGFSLEVGEGGGKSLKLVKAIFLPASSGEVSESLPTGVYPVDIDLTSGRASAGVLRVLASEGRVIGNFFDTSSEKIYPVTGKAGEKDVLFSVNCSEAGGLFKCRRIFQGELKKDGKIEGQIKGTGSGRFVIDKRKYAIVRETPYLRDAGAAVSAVSSKNPTSRSGKDKNIVVSSSGDFIKLDLAQGKLKDPFFFKSGRLALYPVKVSLTKPGKLVLYNAARKEGKTELKKITVLATIYPEMSEPLSLDISGQLRSPSTEGYMIGLEGGGEKSFAVFDGTKTALELSYYRDPETYKPGEIVSVFSADFSGDDRASNSQVAKPDGEPDMVLTAEIRAKGRRLQYIEVTAAGKILRRWNTNPFDIYPAIAISWNGNLMNASDGSIDILLEKETEKFKLNLYKGSLEKDAGPFAVKVVIDGKTYSAEVSGALTDAPEKKRIK